MNIIINKFLKILQIENQVILQFEKIKIKKTFLFKKTILYLHSFLNKKLKRKLFLLSSVG
jgi:hypothetical protein